MGATITVLPAPYKQSRMAGWWLGLATQDYPVKKVLSNRLIIIASSLKVQRPHEAVQSMTTNLEERLDTILCHFQPEHILVSISDPES